MKKNKTSILRSVSYPAPTFYSHLAADRARIHYDQLVEVFMGNKEKAKKIIESTNTKLMYFV